MYCYPKNSYLQSYYANVNPRLLNRCVIRARKLRSDDIYDVSPEMQRLCSAQPAIPMEHDTDITRRTLAYGRNGLRILRRDLQDPDIEVVLKSLSTLNDLLRNPEKAYEAIKLKIPERLLTVIPRTGEFIRERCSLTYQILSNYMGGKQAMVDNPKILQLFVELLKDNKIEVRLKIANCLERIASFWMTADNLVDAGFIRHILDRLMVDEPEVSMIHLETLTHLMYGNGKLIAIENGAFDMLVLLLDCSDTEVRLRALRCLMLITSTDIGKQMANNSDLILKVGRILCADEINLQLNAAAVLIFCTMLVKAKVMAAQTKLIPSRLIRLCKNHLNPNLQLLCFKALTNISEHPDVRIIMRTKHLKRIQDIVVTSDLLRIHKNRLLGVILWDPSDLKCTFGNQD
ncbi:hypothetical protein WA026_009964 [Henosepilachna vigintioctopunctata]|uniref:Rhabdoid tumor deletion region protein 1 n=1 Tax=Henosepilachna vigintioctopunctata TaxID=420089 RepID=A0AAW1TV17_9CUCU